MLRTLRQRLRVLALASLLACAGQAFAQTADPALPADEWKAIRQVIETQRAALKRDDAQAAFAFAAQALREQFGTPERFMRMVRAGYQPLLDARYAEFLEGAVIDGTPVQPLRLVQPDNSVLVALYQMQKEADGRWRIAGCMLAPSTVKAA